MVLAGHMGHIMGVARPLIFDNEVQSLGCKILFLLGGYFITISWESDRSVLRYAIKRIVRIWPPLIIAVLFAVFVIGPVFSSLSVTEYFAQPLTWIYLWKNILFSPVYALPGVFADNTYPAAVNGSLWTLPVEMVMYIMVPIVVTLLFRKKKKINFIIMCILTAAVCAFQIVHVTLYPTWSFVVYGSDVFQMFDLLPFYLIGMLFTFPYLKKILNVQIALIVFIVGSCLKLGTAHNFAMVYLALPYIVFSLGCAPNPKFSKLVPPSAEISYGIYLYGFMIQQAIQCVLITKGIAMSFTLELILSAVITAVLAFLSHKFIEMPIVNASKKLLKKLKPAAS